MASDLKSIERTIWEAERDQRREVTGAQMLPITEMRLLSSGEWHWPSPEPLKRTIFGIPVLLDPAMQPGEIKLVAECGCTVRLINLD